jgi:hypothetical protein
MRMRAGKVEVVLVATSLIITACHSSDRDDVRVQNAGIVSRDTARVLGPGDIRIVSVDSTIELTLVGDSIMTGLADKTLAKLKAETDTGAVTGKGFTANLEKMIKSSVQSALSKQLTFPVSTVSDVRFTDGTLEMVDASGKRMASFGGKSATSSHEGKFSEADSRAFIAAFRARKALQRSTR